MVKPPLSRWFNRPARLVFSEILLAAISCSDFTAQIEQNHVDARNTEIVRMGNIKIGLIYPFYAISGFRIVKPP